ncbi:MAG: FAD-dependent oxidoreductase [Polyangia bacterium]
MSNRSIANDSGTSLSVWMSTKLQPADTELPAESTVDVCVIGAGLAGVSSAYLLCREGKRVIVLDDGPIGGGETGRTTAHLASVQDDRFTRLTRYHGTVGARLAQQSHAAAIDTIESICSREQIDCGFERVDGYLFPHKDGEIDFLKRELEAARRAGLEDAELVPRAPLPGFDTGPALRFPRQGQFHPLKYLRGLVAATEKNAAAKVFFQAHADSIKGDKKGGPVQVKTADGRVVTASAVVIATNAPINSLVELPLKQAAYRSYVVALRITKGTVPRALYWDTEDPYHYVRLQDEDATSDLLIVGGEDHRTGQDENPETRFQCLEKWTRERFPEARELVIRWSGQVMEPMDGLGYIGKSPGDENIYMITGDSGQGMTHGTLGAALITDLILGRKNPFETLYEPSRKTLRAAAEFLRENANVAVQYLDWLGGSDVHGLADIAPGSGALLRKGGSFMAVYRDESGACHARSGVCTHLGGIVTWNPVEKTWDCPCHGTRYSALGRVLNGPANTDLPVLKLEEET